MANTSVGTTKTFDPSKVDLRKFRNKWRSRKQLDTAGDVRDRYSQMQLGRRTSCPLSESSRGVSRVQETDTDRTGDGGSRGSNWKYHWDSAYSLWSMDHEFLEGRSNLKSPTSYAPVEALLAEFAENDTGLTLTPTQDSDREKAMVMDYTVKHWEKKARVNNVNRETMKEAAITGSSFRHTVWQRLEREVELIQGSQAVTQEIHDVMDKGSDEEKDKIRKTIKKDRKPLTKKKTIIEYDDIVHIPVSIYEIFVDPSARVMRGPAYEAMDIIWRQLPSLEQFRREFKQSMDPFVIRENIDMVVPSEESQNDYGDQRPLFEAPQDLYQSDQVELIRYYNKATDKYIVIANDVVVRDGPLPYNHKELPFSLHKFINWPQQFYGIGLPTMLESLQSEDETLRNLMIEQAHLEINPPLLINSDMFEDVDTGWSRIEPGQKIEVSGDPNNVVWMRGSGYKPEFTQLRQSIEQDAVKTSGINPMAYSMPKPGEPVRNNMMSLESTLKIIKKNIKNWSAGYREAMLQTIKLMQQYYPDSYIEDTDNSEDAGEKKYRSIRTEGVKLSKVAKMDNNGKEVYDKDGELENEIMEEKLPQGQYDYFELSGEYMDLDGELDVEIDVDTLVPISQGLKMQNADKWMAQLTPLLADPNMMQNPAIAGLVRYYMDVNGLPNDVKGMLNDADDENELIAAEVQNQTMAGGENVAPIPGESEKHKETHMTFLLDLISDKQQKEEQLTMPDPMMTMEGMQKIQEDLMEMDKTVARIADHLNGDKTPKPASSDYALSMAAPPPPPMGPGGPMGPEMMGPEAGGPMGGPMTPEAMMGGGVPPMAGAPMM